MASTTIVGSGDWDSLVDEVGRGDCILMLGPDAVTEVVDGKPQPVLTGLSDYLAAQLDDSDHISSDAPPWSVAQAVMARTGSEGTLKAWARKYLKDRTLDQSALSLLAQLPFELVVNTVPGVAIEQAWLEGDGTWPGKPGTKVAFYDRTAGGAPVVSVGTRDAPLIYHLLGSLDNIHSLILSESDLVDLLVRVISQTPPVPKKVSSALLSDTKTFLFLGFRLRQWPLRVLLRALAAHKSSSRSYALEAIDRTPDLTTQQFYRQGHNISFYELDTLGFAQELVAQVQPEAPRQRRALELETEAPLVFICHASEDKERAIALAGQLEAEGIRAWVDAKGLRGGDDWNHEIKRLITDKVVQYVVVLQSRALAEKASGESYVNREINLALERQGAFLAGSRRRFLIPVSIDGPDARLPDLEHLQSIDLDSDESFDDLVLAIKRDRARAAKA